MFLSALKSTSASATYFVIIIIKCRLMFIRVLEQRIGVDQLLVDCDNDAGLFLRYTCKTIRRIGLDTPSLHFAMVKFTNIIIKIIIIIITLPLTSCYKKLLFVNSCVLPAIHFAINQNTIQY